MIRIRHILTASVAVLGSAALAGPAGSPAVSRPSHTVAAPAGPMTTQFSGVPSAAPGISPPAKFDTSTLKPLPASGAKSVGKGRQKGPSVNAAGVWTWTRRNRNGQPMQVTLQVAVAKNGTVTGTLHDSSGDHVIQNPVLTGDTLTFTVLYHSPGRPDVPFDYTVTLDSNNLGVSVDRPDFSPAGKQAGRKFHRQFSAAHQ